MTSELDPGISLNSKKENPKYKISLLALFLTTFGLLFYICDICTDVLLALWYLKQGHYLFCVLTLVPIYLATVIDLVASWFREELNNKGTRFWLQCTALCLVHLWGVKIILSLLVAEYRAYKLPKVDSTMHNRIRKKTIREAWLKYNEGSFEASLQAILQIIILTNMKEISTSELPLVTKCGKLEAFMHSFDLPFPIFLSLVISICGAIVTMTNLDKAIRLRNNLEVSTSGIVLNSIWLILTAVSRILSIRMVLLTYPLPTAGFIGLHILFGTVFWFHKFSSREQSLTLRGIKALLNGTRWFLSPYYRVKWKEMLFALHVIHLIGNAGATTTWALHVTSPYTIGIFNATIFMAGTMCCGFYYRYHGEQMKPRSSVVIRNTYYLNPRPDETSRLSPQSSEIPDTFDN